MFFSLGGGGGLNVCRMFCVFIFLFLCYEVELESAVAELEESNSKLTKLRAEHDAAKKAGFPVLNLAGKHSASGKVRDKQKDLRDMEFSLKELKVIPLPPLLLFYVLISYLNFRFSPPLLCFRNNKALVTNLI